MPENTERQQLLQVSTDEKLLCVSDVHQNKTIMWLVL
jgi:hypothetical protein